MHRVEHVLVVPETDLGASRCSCGVELAPLLPRYPRAEDVSKAWGLHAMAEGQS
jgi:hypothetical protein